MYVPPMDGGNQVFVLGEVRTPGAYPVEAGREVTLVELIARAGGHDVRRRFGRSADLCPGRCEGLPVGTYRCGRFSLLKGN